MLTSFPPSQLNSNLLFTLRYSVTASVFAKIRSGQSLPISAHPVVPPNSVSMSQGLLPAGTTSPSETEKSATSQKSNLSAPKLRSCVVCRTRKVRCDKLSPCSNCRRANIACVSPSADRPPRWARRLDLGRIANNAASAQVSQDPEPAAAQARVMERLRTLESLVKDLSGQLEHANASATANSTNGGSSGAHSPESSSHKHDRASDNQRNTYANSDVVQKQFGRIVLEDANQSRYVSSGVWSRLNDEVCCLNVITS